ncbi:hypothetical protein A4X13_0g5922 [Tilletia indica]|uniref:TRIP4/RQT4 C2HC5-type zinc finger domain-containing protein n=1 Tax=Tilletia indica TaxID=43049 RepID=A0A177TC12_9BASI|nr:hypothetical protein A4X13_0g5922 [Tilletia indica]
MVATTVTTRLAELTGLDTESIQSQLIPFLSTFTTPDSLRVHLVDLLGSSQAARTFISDYVIQRFPRSKPPPPPSEPAQVIPQASGSGSGSGRQGKTKLTAKQRLLQPAKAKRIVKDSPEALFGPVGTVYHKEANFVLDGYRAASTSASASASASASGTTTPALVEHGTMSRQGSASNKTAHENQPAGTGTGAGADLPAPELETIAPTPAMKDIDALLAELVVPEDDSTPSELVICFCQGRVHPLHPHQPLCPTCALPICTSLHPSPLHPLSRCPSCARSPILPPHSPTRTTLISTLQSRRLALELEERERIERVRRERRVRDDGIRERVNAFPALDGSLPTVVPQMGTYGMAGYGPRSNAVAIALGRRAPTEVESVALQTRTHRVLRIPTRGAPSNKKSGGKKSKKTKVAAAVGGGGKETGSKSVAAAAAPAVAAAAVDEEEEGDSDEAEHEHALEVSITILIPDPTDDGWSSHQPPSSSSISDDQQLAIQRQRDMARTVGGQRLLANPRLRLEERPTYTGKREREVRRVAWEAVLLAEGEGLEEDEEGEGS